jgi:hypothetical protein
MPDNGDRLQRTFSIQCASCRWKFRCPAEQLDRVICRACESRQDAAQAAQAE